MGGICRPQFLAEQTAQQGDQGDANQGNTAASHEPVSYTHLTLPTNREV